MKHLIFITGFLGIILSSNAFCIISLALWIYGDSIKTFINKEKENGKDK